MPQVSSVELERVCTAASADIADAAAVAVPPPGGGPDHLVLFLVLNPGGKTLDAEAARALCHAAVRRELNPLFKIHSVALRESLPRTASNKVMRRVLREQAAAEARSGGGGRSDDGERRDKGSGQPCAKL